MGKYSSGAIFKPETYKTYGQARKAMKNLMEQQGYNNLTQTEKEIVGRWNLIQDQTEFNNLFNSTEQQIITDGHKSNIKTINSGTPKDTISLKYVVMDEIIFNSSFINEILNVVANTRCQEGVNYSIRLYDSLNHQTIAELTNLTNIRPSVIDLGSISNQPNTNTILEVQIKRNSGIGKVYYKSIQLQVI